MVPGFRPKRTFRAATLGLALGAGLGAAFGSVGCASKQTEPLSAAEFQANAKAAYEDALERFHRRDWAATSAQMDEVKRQYAGTRWARLAHLRIADAQFKQSEFAEAITTYREFLKDYPTDPDVPYARFQVIVCQFESRGESVTAPPLEERDLANVLDAYQTIEAFQRDYPEYPEHVRLEYMRSWVHGMLARHELYVARYYLSRDNFDAAISRTEYALRTYVDTGLEAEALVLLGETQMKRGERDKAREAFDLVLARYPKSPFVEPARRFLARVDAGYGGTKPGPSVPGAPPSATTEPRPRGPAD